MEETNSEEKAAGKLTKRERKMQRREEREKERQREAKRRKTSKTIKPVLVLVGLLVIGLFLWRWPGRDDGDGSVSSSSAAETGVVTETDWVKGDRHARVVLTEYSDFQCPACASYSGTIKQLGDEYSDKIAIVYRHFPLRQIHDRADLAAVAAEAAGSQGKFWEMHDLLFERQSEWSQAADARENMLAMARELGLDEDKFKEDLESDVLADKVDGHLSNATRLKLKATPTFFLNGEELKGLRTYDQFKNVIEEAINAGEGA